MKWLQKLALNYVIKQHSKFLSTKGEKGVRLSFSGRYIPKAVFTNTDLTESIFCNAKMEYADLSHSTIRNSDFSRADLSFAKFEQAHMFKADLAEAQLRKATHQIHVRNRQKEDLIRVFDRIRNMEDNDFKRQLTKFLRDNNVQQPRI